MEFSICRPGRPFVRPGQAALVLFDWVLKGGFAEICLSKRAPDLNLGDVGHVFGHRDLAVHLAAFDRQFLQQVNVAVRIDDLPMWIGRVGSLEVVGQSQDAVAVLGGVCHVTGVGFRALKRSTLVGVLSKAARCSNDQRR